MEYCRTRNELNSNSFLVLREPLYLPQLGTLSLRIVRELELWTRAERRARRVASEREAGASERRRRRRRPIVEGGGGGGIDGRRNYKDGVSIAVAFSRPRISKLNCLLEIGRCLSTSKF